MKWFILLVGIVVLCLVVALLLGLAGGGLGRASSSLSHEPLPDEPLADTDFDDLVFDVWISVSASVSSSSVPNPPGSTTNA